MLALEKYFCAPERRPNEWSCKRDRSICLGTRVRPNARRDCNAAMICGMMAKFGFGGTKVNFLFTALAKSSARITRFI